MVHLITQLRIDIYQVFCLFLLFGIAFGYEAAPNIIVLMADDLVKYIDKNEDT